MECKRVSELLPWLMNGTLPEPEKSLVSEHLAGCATCRRSSDETKFVLSSAQSHVPIEVLLDYADGHKLKNFDPVLFEKHLAVCNECSEQLKLVSDSFGLIDVEESKNNVVSFEKEKEKGQKAVVVTPAQNRFWKYAAIAACLLLTFTLFGWLYNLRQLRKSQSEYVAQEQSLRERINKLETANKENSDNLSQKQTESQREIEELKNKLAQKEREAQNQKQTAPQTNNQSTNTQQPQANVVALDVFPSSVTRSDESNENLLTVPRNAQSVTLILNSQSAANFPRYSIELIDSSGRIIWRNNNMRPFSANDFTVNFPTALLRTSGYTINIYGFQNSQKTKVETYKIRIAKS